MLIFHHIPKTAGTSFVELLRRNYAEAELHCPYEENVIWREWYRSLGARERMQLRCVASHSAHRLIPVLIEEGARFEVITLLRDPVERCISLYHFVLELARKEEQQFGGRVGRMLLEKNWSLQDIYLNADQLASSELGMLMSGFFNGQARTILRPSGVWLGFSPGPLRPAEAARLAEVMKHYDVGTTEDYHQTIERWGARFSWRWLGCEILNVTQSRRDAPPLSSKTIELIRSYNQIDAELHRSYRGSRG